MFTRFGYVVGRRLASYVQGFPFNLLYSRTLFDIIIFFLNNVQQLAGVDDKLKTLNSYNKISNKPDGVQISMNLCSEYSWTFPPEIACYWKNSVLAYSELEDSPHKHHESLLMSNNLAVPEPSRIPQTKLNRYFITCFHRKCAKCACGWRLKNTLNKSINVQHALYQYMDTNNNNHLFPILESVRRNFTIQFRFGKRHAVASNPFG